jgi:HrpA-like RNA helicase
LLIPGKLFKMTLDESLSVSKITAHSEDLPDLQIAKHREEILAAIGQNLVTIISAVTGSGKVSETSS